MRKRAKITGSLSHKDGKKIEYERSEFGDAVLILDETNTKVRVIKADGFAVWIPKYFLLKELTPDTDPELGSVLVTLKVMAGKLQGTLSTEEQQQIQEAMNSVRRLMDRKKS